MPVSEAPDPAGPYGRRLYAEGLAEGERGRTLAFAGGHVLVRDVPGTDLVDVAGPYPLLGLDPAQDLTAALAALKRAGAVSLIAVLDPLHQPSAALLQRACDVARPFKTHFLAEPVAAARPSRNHRDKIRRALRHCRVEELSLRQHLADWERLGATLAERHGIGGHAGVPASHIAALAEDPACTLLAARDGEGRMLAMSLWLSDGETAYNHLVVSAPEGYEVRASYALYASALERFAGCRAIDFGGVPGREDDPDSGLARFKRGFSNTTRSAWLVGAILDPARYAELSRGLQTDYFPAYRDPGLGADPVRQEG